MSVYLFFFKRHFSTIVFIHSEHLYSTLAWLNLGWAQNNHESTRHGSFSYDISPAFCTVTWIKYHKEVSEWRLQTSANAPGRTFPSAAPTDLRKRSEIWCFRFHSEVGPSPSVQRRGHAPLIGTGRVRLAAVSPWSPFSNEMTLKSVWTGHSGGEKKKLTTIVVGGWGGL